MKFNASTADVFVPDGGPLDGAMAGISNIGIGAHPDDLEIMAAHGILKCFGSRSGMFLGVVVSDGANSPRSGLYADYTDTQMVELRKKEQRKAAVIGGYGASVVLGHPTADVKDPSATKVVEDLKTILAGAPGKTVYTHNPADKHDTHVAVMLRTIQAARELPAPARPAKVYGCEVWRSLDWMLDEDKAALDVGGHDNIAAALVGIHDSQVAGGKRYDLATIGRRQANATYHATHATDDMTHMTYAMDLTPLVVDPSLDIAAFVSERLERFSRDVTSRIGRLRKK